MFSFLDNITQKVIQSSSFIDIHLILCLKKSCLKLYHKLVEASCQKTVRHLAISRTTLYSHRCLLSAGFVSKFWRIVRWVIPAISAVQKNWDL